MLTDKKINGAQLSYELNNAALKVVGPYEDGTYKVEALENSVTEEALSTAVDNHTADDNFIAPEVQQQIEAQRALETNETTVNDRLDAALAAMRAHVARGTFTTQQRDAALLLVLRVCIGLVRLARRRFDGTD